jgi:hypothetical protein
MIVEDVMDEVADQLDTIAGLRVFAFPPDSLTPPAAIVSYPDEIVYDATYGRGMDRLTLPVVVVVGRLSDRATKGLLTDYTDGAGGGSIKAVVEAGTYTAFDTVRVTRAEFDAIRIGSTDYLAGMFDLDVAGQGA